MWKPIHSGMEMWFWFLDVQPSYGVSHHKSMFSASSLITTTTRLSTSLLIEQRAVGKPHLESSDYATVIQHLFGLVCLCWFNELLQGVNREERRLPLSPPLQSHTVLMAQNAIRLTRLAWFLTWFYQHSMAGQLIHIKSKMRFFSQVDI